MRSLRYLGSHYTKHGQKLLEFKIRIYGGKLPFREVTYQVV